jgi:selenocysteine-specific elongation factor
VLDPAAVRSRSGDAGDLPRLAALDSGDAERVVAALLDQAMERGVGSGDLVRRSGLPAATLSAVVERLVAAGRARGRHLEGLLSAAAADRVSARLLGMARQHHRQRPLEPGIPLQELRTRGAPHTAPAAVDDLLAELARRGDLRILGERVAASGHEVRPDAASQRLIDEVVEAVRRAGLDPPDPAALLKERGVDERRVQDIVSMLRSRGELVRVADGLVLHREAVERVKDLLWRRRETEPMLDVAAFKDLTRTPRRIAIPLLEYLDAERVTVRRGNQRLIQSPPSRA